MTVRELIEQLEAIEIAGPENCCLPVHVVMTRATEMPDCRVEAVHLTDGVVWIDWPTDREG